MSFHADFARFTQPPIFSSDALPTNTAIGPGSFDDSNVTLLPPAGVVTGSNTLTSLTLTATIHGDFSRDSQVTAADIPAMLSALTDLNAYRSARSLSSGQLVVIGDFDDSDSVTNRDIQGLLNLLANSGSGSMTAVPEPTTIVLALLGLSIGAVQIRRSRLKRPDLSLHLLGNNNCPAEGQDSTVEARISPLLCRTDVIPQLSSRRTLCRDDHLPSRD